jgi:hypothetical protein
VGNEINNKKGEKMENLKIQLSNYPYMSYETYRVLKAKILKLTDKEIADLHEHMDMVTENEGEFSADIDTEEDWRDYQRRVKYINKLKKVTWKAVEREMDRYSATPVETMIKEADTDILLEMNKYEVNGTTMTQKVKDLVQNELKLREVA